MDQIQQLFNNSMAIFANCKSLACYRWDKRNEIKADARPIPFRPIRSNLNSSTTHINDNANGLAFYIQNQYGMLRPTDLFHIFLFSSLFSRFEINAIEIHKPFSLYYCLCLQQMKIFVFAHYYLWGWSSGWCYAFSMNATKIDMKSLHLKVKPFNRIFCSVVPYKSLSLTLDCMRKRHGLKWFEEDWKSDRQSEIANVD